MSRASTQVILYRIEAVFVGPAGECETRVTWARFSVGQTFYTEIGRAPKKPRYRVPRDRASVLGWEPTIDAAWDSLCNRTWADHRDAEMQLAVQVEKLKAMTAGFIANRDRVPVSPGLVESVSRGIDSALRVTRHADTK